MEDLASTLEENLISFRLSQDEIVGQLQVVREEVLKRSRYLLVENFTSIHEHDLRILFEAYDARFFNGLCGRILNSNQLRFRLSMRMTRAAGTTTRFIGPAGEHFVIAIACGLLFDCFRTNHRDLSVGGRPCGSRLDALQRIFEHELVHLVEQLCWGESECAKARFQDIAARFFLHRTHTHQLITRKERAANAGLHVGSNVEFVFEGRRMIGRVNRVTKGSRFWLRTRQDSSTRTVADIKSITCPLDN